MKTFHCDRCGQLVFFENTHCERCGGMLGYQPERLTVSTFEPTENGMWRSLNPDNDGHLFKQCTNYAREEICNWMLPADSPAHLCASCQLTRIIPALTSEKNRIYWKRLEAAKRRLLYSLWQLELQPMSMRDNPDSGLAFEFLEDMPHGPRVLTGHDNGVITLNIAEADPANRERTREEMREPYRTLLGHFRHESGHYYFDRLIADSKWLGEYRELFGDERQDYSQCLQRHYSRGPLTQWEQEYITAYASSHPWEDWAETWAHYLHMTDTLETAHACGMILIPQKPREPVLTINAPIDQLSFDTMMNNWFSLTYAMNSLNRSIGMPDAYPFMLSPPVIKKLRFVHKVVNEKKERAS